MNIIQSLKSSDFAQSIFKGAVSSAKIDACKTGTLWQKIAAIKSYGSHLRDNAQTMTILINAFCSDPDIIPDSDLTFIESSPAPLFNAIAVSDDTWNLLRDAFDDVYTALQCTGDGFTIIDGSGYPFKFVKVDGEWYTVSSYYEGRIFPSQGYINTIFHSMDGSCHRTILSFVSSITRVNTVNEMVLDVCDFISSGVKSTAVLVQTISSFVQSKWEQISSAARHIISIANSKGFLGLIEYVLFLIKNAVSQDQDSGHFEFTNNKLLMPSEYIGSIIGSVFQTIGSILLFIPNLIAKIVGAVAGLTGLVFGDIGKKIWSDYVTKTVLAVCDYQPDKEDPGVFYLESAPCAICQFQSTNVSSTWIYSFLQNNSGVAIMSVPGGNILVGLSVDSDGNYDGTVKWEFHPAVTFSIEHKNSWGLYFFAMTPGGTSANYYAALSRSPVDADVLEQDWEYASLHQNAIEYEDDELVDGKLVVTSTYDKTCRSHVVRNIGTFLLWCSAVSYKHNGGSYFQITHPSVNNAWSGFIAALNGGQFNFDYSIMMSYIIACIACSVDGSGNLVVHQHTYANSAWSDSTYNISTPSWSNIVTFCTNQASTSSVTIPTTAIVGCQALASYSSDQSSYPQPNTITTFTSLSSLSLYSPGYIVVTTGYFMGDLPCDVSKVQPLFYIPQYNRATFWAWVVTIAAVTIAVTTVAVVASLKVRKSIIRARARSAAKVEQAWNNLSANPNALTAEAYRKTAKKANLQAKLIGGTTYNVSNYWDAPSSGDEGSNLLSNILDTKDSDVDNTADARITKANTDAAATSLENIQGQLTDLGIAVAALRQLIKGSN